jgi:hypothetical protein
MLDSGLSQSVAQLARVLHAASDETLGRAWAWGDYAEEGVRFTAFVAAGHLRELAAVVASERVAVGRAPTIAQRILAQYHQSYRDLQGLLIGIDRETAEQAPAEGEWPLRLVLQHIVEADAGFAVVVRVNLERHRNGIWDDEPLVDADYDAILGSEDAFRAQLDGPFAQLVAYHAQIHAQILADLDDISDTETLLPARFWEQATLPIRFRLQRFEAHMRQHSIQAEKTLAGIGRAPTEGRLLARLLYASLADLEGQLLGAPDLAVAQRAEASQMIAQLAAQAEAVCGR